MDTPAMSPNFTSSFSLTLLLGGGVCSIPHLDTPTLSRCISSHSQVWLHPHLPPILTSCISCINLFTPRLLTPGSPSQVSTLLNIHLIDTDSERLNERLSDGVNDDCVSTKHPPPSLETWGFPFLFSFLSSFLILLLCRMKDKHWDKRDSELRLWGVD